MRVEERRGEGSGEVGAKGIERVGGQVRGEEWM